MSSDGVEALRARGAAEFEAVFGRKARLFAAAPGRVNLIGEHVDYCDGFVLPMAIDKYTVIVGAEREKEGGGDGGECWSIYSVNFPSADRKPTLFTQSNIGSKEGFPGWAQYVRGVLSLFPSSVPSFEAVVVSSVPMGGGLSSSAALEVATFAFLQALTPKDAPIDPTTRALLCQKAEQDFAGLPCGVMDQFISSLGKAGEATLIDCRSVSGVGLPLPPRVAVVVVNSHVRHSLSGSEYPERQAATAAAARLLDRPALRDVSSEELAAAAASGKLGGTLLKRARHVVGEIERTQAAAKALRAADFTAFGKAMRESHASLRDDFEVSCPELDELVTLADEVPGVFGSRMTGGGFGGCTVTLCTPESTEALAKHIKAGYSGKEVSIFICQAAGGAFHGTI